MLRDCVHTDVGFVFCLQNLSYELPILSFISFGLESTFLHGFSHKTLFELRPLRLQLHLKHNPNWFAMITLFYNPLVTVSMTCLCKRWCCYPFSFLLFFGLWQRLYPTACKVLTWLVVSCSLKGLGTVWVVAAPWGFRMNTSASLARLAASFALPASCTIKPSNPSSSIHTR